MTLTYKRAKEIANVSYLGAVGSSTKIAKAGKYNEDTYVIYLAPANQSGHEVCPMRSQQCTKLCLNTSGHNRFDIHGRIDRARIAKTKLFFDQKDTFMFMLIREIERYKKAAERKGHRFSVRLNGTSDIDPRQFTDNGLNILELFPEVQFYDYTKVPRRLRLNQIDNYDVTFSYSGANMTEFINALLDGYRGALVFEGPDLPKTWNGFEVIDGDKYDMRYLDPQGVVVGLRFKKVRTTKGIPKSAFIIRNDDPDLTW